MKKFEVEIPDGKKLELIDGVYKIVDDKPRDICERIKTFEDACNYLSNLNCQEEFKFSDMLYDLTHCVCHTKDLDAYIKLRIICAALNEGETMNDKHDWYYPFFRGVPFGGHASVGSLAGFVYSSSVTAPSYAYASIGSRLCLKDKRLSDYCGKQFKDLWLDFYLG